EVARCT
ncbi:hypothetical protein LDH14_09560, partial [Mycobacterium tuberculosis]